MSLIAGWSELSQCHASCSTCSIIG